MEKENREHKDSLFVDLFYRDQTAKENLLSLYNALHDASLQNQELIHKVSIEQVLFRNFKNDIAFEADGKVVVFGEHQSTVCPNMPLRCLMYAGRTYEELVDNEARYKTKLAKISTPEFYIFYNGKDDQPTEQELRLSDAFLDPSGSNSLELKVTVININTNKNHKLLKKCKVLREYSLFIETVRKYERANERSPIKKAVYECIEKGILADYLTRRGSEVRNMLIGEYSYETDIRVKQEESREDGLIEGRIQGELLNLIGLIQIKVKKGLSAAEIADMLETELPMVNTFCQLIREHPESDREFLYDLWAQQNKQ